MSPAYEKIWGRTCNSVYADRARAHEEFTAHQSTGFDYEFRIVRPGGQIRWVLVRGFPILDDAGKPYRTAGVASDVTARKQVESDLHESDRRFGDLLRDVQLASVMLDREARITFCNDYLLQLTGWGREEVIGKKWFDFFTPSEESDADDFYAMLDAAVPATRRRDKELVTRSDKRRLIRWNNSLLRSGVGEVTGSASIGEDVLEETGLIYEVGRWALHRAIADYLGWRSAGLAAVRVAVNVSPLQLRNRGFIGQIEQTVGIDPHAAAGLELEITESLVMEDVRHSIAVLQSIRVMGVRIAVDVFGTGFSSLSYLAKLPVHTLKIDRSFILDMTGGADGLARSPRS